MSRLIVLLGPLMDAALGGAHCLASGARFGLLSHAVMGVLSVTLMLIAMMSAEALDLPNALADTEDPGTN